MTHQTLLSRSISIALLLFVLIARAHAPGAVVFAQNAEAPPPDRAPTEALIASATSAATDAGLSDAQSVAIRSILEQADPAPGVLWTVAASIHQEIGTEATRAYAASLRPDRSEMRGRRGGPRGSEKGRPGKRGGPNADGPRPMLDALDLTDAQREEMAEIRSRYRSQMRDQRSGQGRPSPDEREEMRLLRDEMREEMRAVLTEEQRAELDELRGQRMAERAERRVERQAARDEALNLTEEQAEQMSALRDEVRANWQDGERPDRPEMQEAIAEILNEEQQAVFELHRSLMMHMRAEMGPNRPRGMRRGGRG